MYLAQYNDYAYYHFCNFICKLFASISLFSVCIIFRIITENVLNDTSQPSTVIYETISAETGKHKTTTILSSDKVEEHPAPDTMMTMIQNVSYATHCSLSQSNDFYDMVLDQNDLSSQQTEYITQ